MAAKNNPTVRRRRLGAELRRLRVARGLKSTEVAERLMVSQPKISHWRTATVPSARAMYATCARSTK